MASTSSRPAIKLIVNADDFGKSEAVNQAIIRAHDEGILTSCSLMVTGEACQQAVELAKKRPKLAVGLHLVLICGRAALPPNEILHIVDNLGNFSNDSFAAGLKYFFSSQARTELRKEIWAQVKNFVETGLPCSHVDGHLHMHMHPVAFSTLIEAAEYYGIKHVRLPRENLRKTLQIRPNSLARKLLWWSIFNLLSRYVLKGVQKRNFKFVDNVYGLLESGNMTEEYLLKLLPTLDSDTNEIYSHPELLSDEKTENIYGEQELAALVSEKVNKILKSHNIELITYANL